MYACVSLTCATCSAAAQASPKKAKSRSYTLVIIGRRLFLVYKDAKLNQRTASGFNFIEMQIKTQKQMCKKRRFALTTEKLHTHIHMQMQLSKCMFVCVCIWLPLFTPIRFHCKTKKKLYLW